MQKRPTITEIQFLGQIIDLAHLCGWRVQHQRPAWTNKGYRTPIQGDAGFPDLVLVRPPRCLFVELKSDKGKLSPEQERWLRELSACLGIQVCIWRPSDFDKIVEILRG